jgi:mannose-6-phosphate isomerase-like protein (cupin superfamily)
MTPHLGSFGNRSTICRRSGWLLASFGALSACSRIWPEPIYPPPMEAPIPYIPFEHEESLDELAQPAPASSEQVSKSAPAQLSSTALPSAPPSELERRASCAEKICRLDGWLPDASFAKTTLEGKESSAALWLHEIAASSTLVIPRHQELDVLSVVLSGELSASSEEGGYLKKLGVWDALRMPGAGCVLRAGAAPAKVVLALVTKKPSLNESIEHGKARGFEVRWRKRPAPPESANLASAGDLGWGGGAFHARIAFGGEGAAAKPESLEALLMARGASIPEHDHPSWEHIAVLAGSGRFKLGGSDYPVKPGSIFHIPVGVRHAFVADSSAEVVAIQLYSPSGPEQRFVKLAAAESGKSNDATKPAPVAPAPTK